MNHDVRQRIRHAMLARHATSPKLRGKYQRSIRAARLAREAHAAHLPAPLIAHGAPAPPAPPGVGAPPGLPALPRVSPSPPRTHIAPVPPAGSLARHIAIWAITLACLPVLLLGAIGVYALHITAHTQAAISRIYVPQPAGIGDPRATTAPPQSTITADAQGTIAPRATVTQPAPIIAPFARTTPFTMLLLGVEDQRNGADDSSRSDTLILAYVDPAARHVNLLSIPRDLTVPQADGQGPAKFADIFAHGDAEQYKGLGGIALVEDTISQYFNITIDYYVRANFDGLQKIVDAVGGVTVDNPYPIKDDTYPTEDFQYTRVYFPAGIMHLNGAEALQYARTRHGDNDYGRNARQQQIILAVREQAVRANLFARASSVIDALGDAVRTSFPPDQWLPFAAFAKDLKADAIQQFNLTDLLVEHNEPTIFYSTIDRAQAVARVAQFAPASSKAGTTATPPNGATATRTAPSR